MRLRQVKSAFDASVDGRGSIAARADASGLCHQEGREDGFAGTGTAQDQGMPAGGLFLW